MKVLTFENRDGCHSLMQLISREKHANRHNNAQLYEVYDWVDKILGIKATRAASSFRYDPEKSKKYENLTLEEMLVFLAEHIDANRLSALFASLSSKESQVCYMIVIGKVVVATLPAGLPFPQKLRLS